LTPPVASAHPRPPQDNHPQQPPWLEHPTLFGLQLPDGTSRRPVYLPRGIEEPEASCLKQREAARSTGFYRDALLIYAVMLS